MLTKELGTEPVLVIVAKGAALAVLRSGRILWDDVERQFRDGYQSLAGVLLHKARGFQVLRWTG